MKLAESIGLEPNPASPNALLSRQPPSLTGLLSMKLAESLGVEPSDRVSTVYGLAIRCLTIRPALQMKAPSLRLLRRRHRYQPWASSENGRSGRI